MKVMEVGNHLEISNLNVTHPFMHTVIPIYIPSNDDKFSMCHILNMQQKKNLNEPPHPKTTVPPPPTYLAWGTTQLD